MCGRYDNLIAREAYKAIHKAAASGSRLPQFYPTVSAGWLWGWALIRWS